MSAGVGVSVSAEGERKRVQERVQVEVDEIYVNSHASLQAKNSVNGKDVRRSGSDEGVGGVGDAVM